MISTKGLAVWRIFVAAQITLVIFLGALSVAKTRIWSLGDERHHFCNIQYIAEQHSLPVFPEAKLSPEILALSGEAPGGPCMEAFQPPLYYISAVPFYAMASDIPSKVRFIRAWSLALYLASLGIAWLICVHCSRDDRSKALRLFSFVLCVAMIPGVIVRVTSVANVSMETFFLVVSFLFFLRALDSPSLKPRIASGIATGLTLLSKLTASYLFAFYALVVLLKERETNWSSKARVIGLIALPFLILSPWMLFNELHYGTLTANALAREALAPWNNPNSTVISLLDLGRFVKTQFFNFEPSEWIRVPLNVVRPEVTAFVSGALFWAPAVLALGFWKSKSSRPWLLGLSLPAMWLLLDGIIWTQDFPLEGQYLYPTWIVWAVFVADTYDRLGRKTSHAITGALFISVLLLWGPAWYAAVW